MGWHASVSVTFERPKHLRHGLKKRLVLDGKTFSQVFSCAQVVRESFGRFAVELVIKYAEHRIDVFGGHLFAALRQHFSEVFSGSVASRESGVF